MKVEGRDLKTFGDHSFRRWHAKLLANLSGQEIVNFRVTGYRTCTTWISQVDVAAVLGPFSNQHTTEPF